MFLLKSPRQSGGVVWLILWNIWASKGNNVVVGASGAL